MTSSLISQLNSTNVALLGNRAFLGSYETVTNYMTAVVTVNTTQNATLTVFQSVDKIRSVETTYAVLANTPLTEIILLTSPYFYLTLRNNSSTAQTFLNLETIYRPSQVVADLSTANTEVNIHSSSGGNLTATGTSLNVNLTNAVVQSNLYANISAVQTKLDAINIASANCLQVYQPAKISAHGLAYNGTATGVGIANILGSFAVGNGSFSKVCLFGNVSALAGGVTPLNISICYSDNGTTWFTTSLGVINFTSTGNFSRDFDTSARYVGFYVDTLGTFEIYYSVL